MGGDRTANFVGLVSFSSQGPGRKPGASLYTRKRFSLSRFPRTRQAEPHQQQHSGIRIRQRDSSLDTMHARAQPGPPTLSFRTRMMRCTRARRAAQGPPAAEAATTLTALVAQAAATATEAAATAWEAAAAWEEAVADGAVAAEVTRAAEAAAAAAVEAAAEAASAVAAASASKAVAEAALAAEAGTTAEAARVTCVVCLTPFGRAHGVSCSTNATHFLCGNAGGAGCLGGHVRARAQALRETDTLVGPAAGVLSPHCSGVPFSAQEKETLLRV